MGKPTGFLEFTRQGPSMRPVAVRLRDWREVYEPQSDDAVQVQGARCMDCGIPFCMQGCPLGNRIPVFNDLVYRGRWDEAAEQLLDTNNFPEFTGRLCPAPCESACVLGIGADPVTIERLEYEVIEHAFARGITVQRTSTSESGRRVAVVGSGPAGLAAASQLRSAGHHVEVFERSDAIGGLLRYGIPEFKLEKKVLDRRLRAMADAGIIFHTSANIADDGTPLSNLRAGFDAVVLALGSTRPRLIPVPGAQLTGIYPAMTYLEAANRAVATDSVSQIDAHAKHVIILGGGDTGADCLGTAHRQGAASVTQIEIMDEPPHERPQDQPWPTMARLFKVTSAHDEGGERRFATETLEFQGDGTVSEIVLKYNHDGSVTNAPADLVFIAAGFVGPELEKLGLNSPGRLTTRDTLLVDSTWRIESLPGDTPVFACGDAVRGQSLIVWAIAEGRSAASAVDAFLNGVPSALPAPVEPYSLSW
ncbi:MAG: glutamate synthase subunit beta [Acidimicrobiaceae bacterium]|nr:glutamate synthase subunit beta [Acidimicrobiaceae bacterium]